jgi:NAD(P)-dependent dehydrogenase (short-subunit alcohol dehydrogenase family)
MDLGLAGRLAFVAGADRGIGLACASALRAEGVRLTADPGEADIVVAHARDPADPQHRFEGPSLLDPDALAGLRTRWREVAGTVACYRTAVEGMAARRWGRLVWIGSAQAKSVNSGGDDVDGVISLAMMGLHKVITGEESAGNITANAVLRGGQADDGSVADVVTFLCSRGAGYLSGTTIVVDGGVGSAVF